MPNDVWVAFLTRTQQSRTCPLSTCTTETGTVKGGCGDFTALRFTVLRGSLTTAAVVRECCSHCRFQPYSHLVKGRNSTFKPKWDFCTFGKKDVAANTWILHSRFPTIYQITSEGKQLHDNFGRRKSVTSFYQIICCITSFYQFSLGIEINFRFFTRNNFTMDASTFTFLVRLACKSHNTSVLIIIQVKCTSTTGSVLGTGFRTSMICVEQ